MTGAPLHRLEFFLGNPAVEEFEGEFCGGSTVWCLRKDWVQGRVAVVCV